MEGPIVKCNGHVAGKATYNGADGGKFSLYPIDPRPPQDDKPPKPQKDPNAPKKPTGGAFGMFTSERREDVRQQIMNETGKKVGVGPVGKYLVSSGKTFLRWSEGTT